jgi:hypothetical protein
MSVIFTLTVTEVRFLLIIFKLLSEKLNQTSLHQPHVHYKHCFLNYLMFCIIHWSSSSAITLRHLVLTELVNSGDATLYIVI